MDTAPPAEKTILSPFSAFFAYSAVKNARSRHFEEAMLTLLSAKCAFGATCGGSNPSRTPSYGGKTQVSGK